ncbi:MAG: Periplasmic component of the Tol biopolymer transport system-like protein [Myxococcales bacterium]|nr:Periplasmic component of the Tol biopolymer transport system-like protein [Myxococcales bacterium]
MHYPRLLLGSLLALSAVGCDDQPAAGPKYYERVIQPILTQNCVFNQGACHKDDGKGNALGNLDLTSYAALSKRKDVLRTYGSFPVPLLLLKASGAQVPPIPYKGKTDGKTDFYPSEIEHAGGATLGVTSSAFLELQKWLANGAQEDGSVVNKPQQMGTGDCNPNFMTVRPDVAAQLPTVDTSSAAFKQFTADVEPVVTQSCAFSTCHSGEQSDFFLTCKGDGSNDASKFNFLEAQAFVGSPPETSMILLKPLAPSGGGIVHTGGVFFTSKNDETWKKLSAWAAAVGGSQSAQTLSDGEKFFDDFVMPVFLKRGCAIEACHSPGSANDFKLRAGSQGFLSRFSLHSNYDAARRDFLVPDIPDARQSRLLKKPVVAVAEGGFGITHRGGPPLQTPNEVLDPTKCAQPFPTDGTATPFCTLVEWHKKERAALVMAGQAEAMAAASTLPLVAVSRPPDGDRVIDFDSYRPGADLVYGRVTVGALGVIDATTSAVQGSLLDNCSGVTAGRANVDVRHPAVSYDASKVAFAMRLAATDTLDLYEVTLDAAHGCTKITNGNGMSKNGMLLHNLDPMYAPDGTLVFASTRGRPSVGPTRSLKFLLPQTDLWRLPRNGTGYGAPEQMTALLGSELAPAMMANGQVTFTAEKASPDFYQLSGRRINWDLTDYHPLLAQRAQSQGFDPNSDTMAMHPSVNYTQATDIREAIDRNFLVILSDVGTKGGGGTLATFNRSIGPFESDRSDIQFLRALTVIDPAATGRAGATQGAYRAPFSLPDGRILASYDGAITDLTAQTPRYDLVVVDPRNGTKATLAGFSGGGKSWVEAALVYKREPKQLFRNLTQLVFGGHVDASDTAHGEVHYPDLPLLGTLLGANLRTGRFVNDYRSATQVVVYEDQGPLDVASGMGGLTGSQMVYSNRKELGRAPLASDGSTRLRLPSLTPIILELQDGAGNKLFTMSEEDQLGPGERISRGVPQQFFNSVCGGCHGSVSGKELDIAIDPDALTGASVSLSRDPARTQSIGP